MVRTRICLMLIHLPRRLKAMNPAKMGKMLTGRTLMVSKVKVSRASKGSRGNKAKTKKTARIARISVPKPLRS